METILTVAPIFVYVGRGKEIIRTVIRLVPKIWSS